MSRMGKYMMIFGFLEFIGLAAFGFFLFSRSDGTFPDGGSRSRTENFPISALSYRAWSVFAEEETPLNSYLRISDLVSVPEVIPPNPKNTYDMLCIPTFFAKFGELYFLVDCYHDQIIYHDNLTDPLTEWNVMTDQIFRGHTLASDGLVYLADDTENNRILVFEKMGENFVLTQTFSEIGSRPHYIVYHEPTDTFYAWSSTTGEMYLFRREKGDNRIYLTEIRSIEELAGVYVRSFTISGEDIYFVSGASCILQARLSDFTVLARYPVPENMAGMIQLAPIQDYYYITVSTDISGNPEYATILRTTDLNSLAEGEFEEIFDYFLTDGTPYYITSIDGAYYMTEHRPAPYGGLWRFQVENNVISDVESLY